MHDQGGEGSHKRPAKQLWIVDLASGKTVGTAPGLGSASLTFAKGAKRLQALDGATGGLNVWRFEDGGKAPRLVHTAKVKTAGEAAVQLEAAD
jgi:methylamine dehydrogenase heavy chain